MRKLSHIKRIRLHNEGKYTLLYTGLSLAILNSALFFLLRNLTLLPFYIVLAISIVTYGIIINFFRCPIRRFTEATENTVVASADGRVVVVEETEENEYFHDRRIMVSIFMSLWNVHANWFPVDGIIKKVEHHNGNFYKAWLPKSSTENERSTIVIETPDGQDILVRQIAGAVARRIVTYARPEEECYIDEHLGFIKFGSRVDIYLPLNAEILIQPGQTTVGNQTIIARLQPNE
ncbi:phosphatidylserine decarboxylase family protein [uncultured Alloprevotella sp.]|uniref:phosphatidylserine decarboxylase family protein n=1 Tax=uncultured Alloprevotella sp. TaxID=1283315 RepID=UPI00262E7C10|nr:phosphatidylserine decarboxylase family protein [uncultured Alloprevotella sp.]